MTSLNSPLSPSETPQKIAVRMPHWLGDVVMATSLVQALLTRFPQAEIDLLLLSAFKELPLPYRGKLVLFDKKTTGPFRLGWTARSEKYDRLYVLPPSFSSALSAFVSGAKERIGYASEGRSPFLTAAPRYRHGARQTHLVNDYLALLDKNLTKEEVPPQLLATPEWVARHRLSSLSLKKPYVVLAPGASYGPAKEWPIPYFGEVAADLRRTHQIVIVGTDKDRAHGDQLAAMAPGAINACGQTSLASLVAVVAEAALFIGNDSGAGHVAAALRRPQISLFGSSSPRWSAPVNEQADIFYLGLPCSPCFQRVCPLGHTHCLKHIFPPEVIAAARQRLARPITP